jgi:sRNA-binding carbon storage regulator CsrA
MLILTRKENESIQIELPNGIELVNARCLVVAPNSYNFIKH